MIHDVECLVCGESFQARSPAAKYCGERCKKRAQRGPVRIAPLRVVVPAGRYEIVNPDDDRHVGWLLLELDGDGPQS
jgi:hypothetical protein